MDRYAAVVLAGGAGRRLGGPEKPGRRVGGRRLLLRVLDAVGDAVPRVVVGPAVPWLPAGVRRTRERPPGGGPVAGTAAGLALVPTGVEYVALLAADLPFLTGPAVASLRAAAAAPGRAGAVFIDDGGQPQWLCGVWRAGRLRERLAALPGGAAGVALRSLLAGSPVVRLPHDTTAGPPPWYDCDTEDDLRRAEEWE